jgi:hypothetical protein
MYYGLSSLNEDTEIYMSNQKDRWAFLIDKLPNKEKIIIQHGTNYLKKLPDSYSPDCFRYDKENDLYVLIMPIKLSNISKIYAFTDNEARGMLLGEHKSVPEVEIIGYDIVLTQMERQCPQILIVGNYYVNAHIEKQIIEYLQSYNIDIFVKSHPSVSIDKYNDLKSKNNFHLVPNNICPKVDLVLSYSSTLALEYENCGISVVYYSDIIIDNAILNKEAIDKYLKILK